uniref:FAD dependent oxidoreductase domain-containing protein n=1 Tax=Chromera velia CCMP2878 TaxID=1169474 RepID=A0A0G4HLJ4_9ALVE|eukprot:Cvel_28799.t1-p1 / transcript=Cvel_28799.t1 / gene=Cvel_28799 / organism=Chromera_velia_CCMP2878 / gene_product=hypothetical protein / transcript_product=hypothetical protein / location=Cvel_scaffold3835:11570-13224(-) / protein_length=217 / sequence_SO=supercontig / SO=protein_coding / is_pseudo=false
MQVSRLVERVPSLPALPSLITAIRPGRAGREKYDVYGLPPIEYGDGGLWMKLGNGDFPMPLRSVEEVKEWFRGGPSSVYEESILEIFRELYPQRDEETGAFLIDSCPHKAVNCALTFTPTRYPFIDEVPGTSGRLVFAVGGCGGAAKSADELGRLAALRLFGQWDSSYDQDIFAVPGNDGKAVFGMHGNDVRRERDRSRTEEGSETADEKEVREVQA